MSDFNLYLPHARAWPNAIIAARHPYFPELSESSVMDPKASVATFAMLTTTGVDGRLYSLDKPLGVWANLAEENHQEDEPILARIRRYGDLKGELSPNSPTHTRFDLTLQTILKPFLAARTPVIGSEISVPRPKNSPEYKRALDALGGYGELFFRQENITRVLDRRGFGFSFANLGDFLFASAASMFLRDVRMRRCSVCGNFFELQRSTAFTCSGTCHTRKAKEKRETAPVAAELPRRARRRA